MQNLVQVEYSQTGQSKKDERAGYARNAAESLCSQHSTVPVNKSASSFGQIKGTYVYCFGKAATSRNKKK